MACSSARVGKAFSDGTRGYNSWRPPVAPSSTPLPPVAAKLHPAAQAPSHLRPLRPQPSDVAPDPWELQLDMEPPTSPLTALVQNKMAMMCDTHVSDTSTPLYSGRSSSRGRTFSKGSVQSRTPSSTRPPSTCSSASGVGAHSRASSQDVLETRQRNAIEYFREAQSINQRSRKAGETIALLEQMRQRKSEAGSRASSKDSCHSRYLEAYASTPRTPCDTEKSSVSRPLCCKNEVEAVVHKSLAEQFGYGVILKTKPSSPRPEQVDKRDPPQRRNTMIEIKAGNNDLHKRLAERRRTLQ